MKKTIKIGYFEKSELLALIFLSSCMNPYSSKVNVVGGNDLDTPFKYQFMAEIEKDGRQLCGGSLIAPDVVLTAGHCL
ncbi:MAG: trypsin-like serine protease, partial [Oligoflexales bacterium]|nr:trypsin-like serine protease [Oligoflexales bacterium]